MSFRQLRHRLQRSEWGTTMTGQTVAGLERELKALRDEWARADALRIHLDAEIRPYRQQVKEFKEIIARLAYADYQQGARKLVRSSRWVGNSQASAEHQKQTYNGRIEPCDRNVIIREHCASRLILFAELDDHTDAYRPVIKAHREAELEVAAISEAVRRARALLAYEQEQEAERAWDERARQDRERRRKGGVQGSMF